MDEYQYNYLIVLLEFSYYLDTFYTSIQADTWSGRGYNEMSDIIWREISVSPEELSLANILPTGQAFRWHKTGSDPEEWSGTISRR